MKSSCYEAHNFHAKYQYSIAAVVAKPTRLSAIQQIQAKYGATAKTRHGINYGLALECVDVYVGFLGLGGQSSCWTAMGIGMHGLLGRSDGFSERAIGSSEA